LIREHPGVVIELDRQPAFFRPGQAISGRYRVNMSEPTPVVQALEWSIEWETETSGTEDYGVHVVERLEPEGGIPYPERWREFEALLPRSPLSYDGLIIKVVWRVRGRAVFGKHREWVGELSFRLGDVAPAREKENKTP
jgi:hypothetical protein